MANLVPLHLDKDTGEIVATAAPPGGGGGGPSTGVGDGFLFIQGIASDVWTIIHNQGSDFLLAQVFTTTGDLLIPDELTLIDINTVEITFGAPIAGRAHIIFFQI